MTRPIVVECGAHDGQPHRLMCHKHLKNGWKGILLEPHAGRFKELIRRHPDQTCLPIGLSSRNGIAGLTTHYNPKVGEAFTGWVCTWDWLTDVLGLEKVNWFVLDVELHEMEVLKGMTKRLPERIMIEMHQDNLHSALEAKGYFYLNHSHNGVNAHYVLRDHTQ